MNFREATSVDRDAILDLRRAAFPKDDREKQQRDFWEWEFVRGYAGPARIFVAEAEGKIVGHLAAIPQRYGELRGALAVDAMTHPDFQRQKVFSRVASFTAERLRDEFEIVTAFQIRDEVRGGMAAGGWVGAGELPVFLRPIIPIARRASDSIRPLRDEEIDSFLVSEKIRQKRTPDFLRWRYRENPHWRYGLDGFFDGDELRAFLIHRPAVLRGVSSLAIVDGGGEVAAFRSLLRDVVSRSGRFLAAALLSEGHPSFRLFRSSGFFRGPHRFRLLTLPKLDARWSLSWGDTDHV